MHILSLCVVVLLPVFAQSQVCNEILELAEAWEAGGMGNFSLSVRDSGTCSAAVSPVSRCPERLPAFR